MIDRAAGGRPDRDGAGAASRRPWRVLPFTDSQRPAPVDGAAPADDRSALAVDFLYVALHPGRRVAGAWLRSARWCSPTTVALLALPALSNQRLAGRAAGGRGRCRRWSAAPGGRSARLVLSVAVLSSIAVRAAGLRDPRRAHPFRRWPTSVPVVVAGAAGPSPCRRPARRRGRAGNADRRLGAPALRPGRPSRAARPAHRAAAVRPACWCVLLAVGLPAAWNVDVDAILRGFGQLLHGVRIGGVTHLAGQHRHGDRDLRRLPAAGAAGAQRRARPGDADGRGADAAAPVDRCRR